MHIGQVILFFCTLVSILTPACYNSVPFPKPNPPSQIQLPSENSLSQQPQLPSNLPSEAPSQSSGSADQVALQIVSVTSPVLAGSKATVVIQTVPNAECDITVNYKSGPSKASGLNTKIADSTGKVLWTWTVGSKTTPGTWQIQIRATCEGKTATKSTYFTVR